MTVTKMMGERLVLQGFLDSFAETSVGYETPVVLETPKLVVSTNISLPQYIPVVKKQGSAIPDATNSKRFNNWIYKLTVFVSSDHSFIGLYSSCEDRKLRFPFVTETFSSREGRQTTHTSR